MNDEPPNELDDKTGQDPLGPDRHRKPNLMPGVSDPYLVLGLEASAEQSEIRQRYFALVRQYPPEQDPETFRIIRAAYEKLRSTSIREETDLFLLEPPPEYKGSWFEEEPDLQHHVEDIITTLRKWREVSDTSRDVGDDFREVKL